jgi:hypothetical protein
MPGLLDNFLADPNLALGAGLLSPTRNGSFGAGLSQGLGARQQAVASQDNSQLRQLQAQIREKGIADANRFSSLISENQAGLQQGNPQAVANLVGGSSNVNQLTGSASLFNDFRPSGVPTTEFERLDALVQAGQATPGQIDRHKKLKDAASGINVGVNLEGLFEGAKARTEGANIAKAIDTSIIDAGKVRSLEGATNTLLRGLANGAPIGAVASAIMTTDVVRSQFSQAINSKAALEDQIADLSGDNKDEFRSLIGLAMQGNEVASQKVSLVYMLAGSRETGKLSDTDLKLAFDSIENGSVEGMITRLVSTRDGAIDQFNAKQRTNRNRRDPEELAFADLERDRVFTTETINNAPDNVIRSLGGMNSLALDKLLDENEKKALIARMLGLQ